MLGFILSTAVHAADELSKHARHVVTLAGLQPGEGRIIRSDEFVNNKFTTGSFFCAGDSDVVYYLDYFFGKSQEPFHADHLTKFSICQDETLANCQEFATDKYQTFRNLEGYLQNDIDTATVDVSPIKAAYHSCEPDSGMDEMVKKAIHLSDRRFAHIG